MALGKRKREQQGLWVATTELPKSPGHPFYQKLNELLAEAQSMIGSKNAVRPTMPPSSVGHPFRQASTSA
jgi:transposase